MVLPIWNRYHCFNWTIFGDFIAIFGKKHDKKNFFFSKFFFEFLKIPFSEHNSARFDEKNFFENFKKKFSKKNYIFKCRMCHFWSLKLWNFVENANSFLYSWRYRHVMSKLFSFSIISRRFKNVTSSSDTVYFKICYNQPFEFVRVSKFSTINGFYTTIILFCQ